MSAAKRLSGSPRNSLATGESLEGLSPELVPIVTLLSSQSHRRYHEGIFMLYYDINSDGKPADREWKEVYGILTGNQLAYWDAANLAQYRHNPEALLETSAKPNYINFTDSVYNAMKVLPAAKQNLDNVVIVSTTLKNRYIIQFKSYDNLTTWYSALRLANFEYSLLQGAYTGALLVARGSRLSDIRTILAEKRFDHEDWISIRYGSGMAWKRCYAVVEPSVTKRKSFTPGRILLYETEQKKKKQLMAVVSSASSVTAIYPQSPQLIDHSTMLKLDAFINLKSPSVSPKVSKKSMGDFTQTNIFLMPEQHSSVPGFDTLIRFLVPLLDSFGLNGRPTRLKADRVDPESLLFGLPTLPCVHYLEVDDIQQMIGSRDEFLSWDQNLWNNNIKSVLSAKLDRGYDGCGSSRGVSGAIMARQASQGSQSPQIGSPLTSSNPDLSKQSRQAQKGPSALAANGQQETGMRQVSAPNPSYAPPTPSKQQRSYSGPSQGQQNQQRPNQSQNSSQSSLPQPQQGKNLYELRISPASSTGSIPTTSNIGTGASRSTAATGTSALGISTVGGAAIAGAAVAGGAAIASRANDNKLSVDQSKDHHRSIQLSDIYQKYSTIKSPSDQFHTDRNQMLNGSHEKFDEEDLPTGMRVLNLQNVYPKNDAELFSDNDDNESDSSQRVDTRHIGLTLPSEKRVSSNLPSPMTQYHDFNEQFAKAAVISKRESTHSGKVNANNFSGFSDSDEDEAIPVPPPHSSSNVRYSPTITPRVNAQYNSDHISVHSESGRVVSSSSYPYSDELPSLPPTNKPKYITSPNNSQNRVHRFPSPEKARPVQPVAQKMQQPLPSLPPQQYQTPPPVIQVQSHSQPNYGQPSQGQPPQGQPAPGQYRGTPPNQKPQGQQQYPQGTYQGPPPNQGPGYSSGQSQVPQYPIQAPYQGHSGQPRSSSPRQAAQGPPRQGQAAQGPPRQGYPQQGYPPQGRPQNQGPPPQQGYPPHQGLPPHQGPPPQQYRTASPPQQYRQGGPPMQNQPPAQGNYRPQGPQYQQGAPPPRQEHGIPPGGLQGVSQGRPAQARVGFPRNNGQAPGEAQQQPPRNFSGQGYQYQAHPQNGGPNYGRPN